MHRDSNPDLPHDQWSRSVRLNYCIVSFVHPIAFHSSPRAGLTVIYSSLRVITTRRRDAPILCVGLWLLRGPDLNQDHWVMSPTCYQLHHLAIYPGCLHNQDIYSVKHFRIWAVRKELPDYAPVRSLFRRHCAGKFLVGRHLIDRNEFKRSQLLTQPACCWSYP